MYTSWQFCTWYSCTYEMYNICSNIWMVSYTKVMFSMDCMQKFRFKKMCMKVHWNFWMPKLQCIPLLGCSQRYVDMHDQSFAYTMEGISYQYIQVLTDNASNCCKLSEEELRQIFQLATSSDNPNHYELCITLQAAIKVLVNWFIDELNILPVYSPLEWVN